MGVKERTKIIKAIEEERDSTVFCYLTSLRHGAGGQIASDAVRILFDHLEKMGEDCGKPIDLYLCSTGGVGTVPWQIVSLFREYCKEFRVLIPYMAYSAATLIALGADEIVMHTNGELGPIDPSVGNEFNPKDEVTRQPITINTEDVSAYFDFVKSTIGIKEEQGLVEALKLLSEKVHPLALGNVARFLNQSRMIAKKILRTHKDSLSEEKIEETVENLVSKLYFHGHPINRKEAKQELGMKITEPDKTLEHLMWALYKDYESALKNNIMFDANLELNKIGQDATSQEHYVAFVESKCLSSCFRQTKKIKRKKSKYVHPNTNQQIETEIVEVKTTKAGWETTEIQIQGAEE